MQSQGARSQAALLPPGVRVWERGWLSSNTILCSDADHAALVDSGYVTHAQQTLDLVCAALGGQSLDMVLNTHLHSDHCGGNARLQQHFEKLEVWVAQSQAQAVQGWDQCVLNHDGTGQLCPQFAYTHAVQPGAVLRLGGVDWQAMPAPGHDPHSLMLFAPEYRVLLSADALWEDGFGIVFPALFMSENAEGAAEVAPPVAPGQVGMEMLVEPGGVQKAFSEVAWTLDLIERLSPRVVVPGHGGPFTDVGKALATARKRLDFFAAHPHRHASHAAKVLIKFKLLEMQQVAKSEFWAWMLACPYLRALHKAYFFSQTCEAWIGDVLAALLHAKAVVASEFYYHNT